MTEELTTLDQQLKDAVVEAGETMREARAAGREQLAWAIGLFKRQLLVVWALSIRERQRELAVEDDDVDPA